MAARKKFDKMNDTVEYRLSESKNSNTAVHTYLFRPAEPAPRKNKVYAVGFIDVFIPFITAFILLVINRFLTVSGAYNSLPSTAFLIVRCLIYLLIFAVPAVVYCKTKNKSFHKELSLHRFSPSLIPFMLLSFLLLITVIATERIAIGYFFPYEETEQIIHLGREENKLGIILAYAVFPAVCEELFLRGLIQNGISEKAGAFTGITVSALTFALLHLDFKYFIVYLTSGLILAVCAHVTNSVFPSLILHTLNNLFSLLFSARLSFIASERTGNSILIVILTLFVFIILLFFLKSLESICIKKAYVEDIKSGNAPEDKKHESAPALSYRTPFRMSAETGYTFHKFLRVIFSPALIVAAIIFMFAVL